MGLDSKANPVCCVCKSSCVHRHVGLHLFDNAFTNAKLDSRMCWGDAVGDQVHSRQQVPWVLGDDVLERTLQLSCSRMSLSGCVVIYS